MRVMQDLPARAGDSVDDIDTPTLIVDLDASSATLTSIDIANAVRSARQWSAAPACEIRTSA
jgi:hypothetical protein